MAAARQSRDRRRTAVADRMAGGLAVLSLLVGVASGPVALCVGGVVGSESAAWTEFSILAAAVTFAIVVHGLTTWRSRSRTIAMAGMIAPVFWAVGIVGWIGLSLVRLE